MKQVLQNLRDGETSVAETPIPTPQKGQALVRAAASLVSAGTERMLVEFAEKSLIGKARSRPDLVRQALDKARREGLLTTIEAAFSRLDQPMPLGYSAAGTIVALGEGMEGFRVGQRVACAGGGFAVHAEYICVPRNLLAPLPEQVTFEAAAFTTLGAIALHGFRLAEAQLGERVAVIGLGLLGLLAVGIARAAGCHVFGADLDPARVALAVQMGAQAATRSQAEEAAASFSRGRGCDAVLICADTTSADPVELAGAIARDRARVVAVGAVGLKMPRKVYYEKELSFINSRSYGPGRYDPAYELGGSDYPIGYVRWTEGRNLEAFVDLLADARLDVSALISHRFPIEQAPEAYKLITGKKKQPFLGVLLVYPQGEEETSIKPQASGEMEAALQGGQFEPRGGDRVGRKVEVVRLGVLGAGNFASAVMLPALQKLPTVELVGIASASGMSAQHAASKFGFRYAASDAAQILNDPDINTVAILTRHHLHASQTLAALAAGKHVFCEKPLALSVAELRSIEEALGDTSGTGNDANMPGGVDGEHPLPGPVLMVGFNRRFAPLARRLKEFLDRRCEPLFAHYRVNAGYIPLNHWVHDPEQGGGRILGEGCHFVDFLAYLVGAPPMTVSAQALPDAGRYQEDNVVITCSFPDGSLGTVSYLANGDKAFPKERVEVFCGGRAAALDDYRSLETVQNGKRATYRSRLRQDKGHRAEWQAFSATLLAGGPPPIPYAQIFGVTRAMLAAIESLRESKTITL
ncbi:MAG: bi-domain-containing oxidoreductase [Anaerolineales bacterium]|nr:bi-domain-containing oxidoreductase [Anaerolineales bacterium]